MTNKFVKPVFVVLIAIFCNILWGTSFPSIKAIYKILDIIPGQVSSVVTLAGIRFFLASIIILLLYKFVVKGKFFMPKGRQLVTILIIGVLQTLFQYVFFFLGLLKTTGTKGSILMASEVFFAIILAHIIFKDDKLSINKIIGMIIGFTGVVLVNLKNGSLESGFAFTGEGFMLLAALSNAIASILIKKYTGFINAVYMTGCQMMFGSILLLIFGLLYGENVNLDFNFTSSVLLIYLSCLSAFAFALWNSLIKYNSVSKVSIYKFLTPVFGTSFSVILLSDEFINSRILISLLFVSLGIIAIYYRKGMINNITRRNKI